MSSDHRPPLLEARGLGKVYDGVQVLCDVSFEIRPGEVLALMGANGAGKSTLMGILSGAVRPDGGALLIDGERCSFSGPADAAAAGVNMVHQELQLAPDLSVAENIFLGRQPKRAGGLIDFKMREAATRDLLDQLSCSCTPSDLAAALSLGQRQLVEIAKALSRQGRLLILDEPTAALSEREVAKLLEIIAALKAKGLSIVFTSHRMEEAFAVADRVLVLRDGRTVSCHPAAGLTAEQLIVDMVGSDIAHPPSADHRPQPSDVLLRARNLQSWNAQGRTVLSGIDLAVRAGQVVGIAGLMGSGRTELLEILAGEAGGRWSGDLHLAGERYAPRAPRDAIAAGVAYVTEDRKDSGLILDATVRENISLASLQRLSRAGLVDRAEERALADRSISDLGIKTAGREAAVAHLSGGNQQKVVLAKWLVRSPRLLLLDEPTRGVDVAAKASFYALLADLVRQGTAVVLVSSDWMELMALSDRIVVLQEGRCAALVEREDFQQSRLLEHATPGGPVSFDALAFT